MPSVTEPDQSSARRRGIYDAAVVSNRPLCDEHFLLRLDVGTDFPPTQAGQFVQVACGRPDADAPPVVHEWSADRPPHFERPELTESTTLLRRPFSLAGRRDADGRTVLEIIHRVVGRGSAWLAKLAEDDSLSVLGPLGNGFSWDESTKLGVLVGGGVGLPPMLYLTERLHAAGTDAVVFAGAMSANLLPLSLVPNAGAGQAGWPSLCVREFNRWSVPAAVTTDDGSAGLAGMVTDALWRWIDQGRIDPDGTIVYTCGPEPMMRHVAEGCIARGLTCQVAMERKMACGMGTCQSCVCKTRTDQAPGWRYSLVCTDGTVFDGRDIIWD